MIKRIIKFTVVIVILFVLTYFPHNYVLSLKEIYLFFSLFNVYLFHFIAAIIVYLIIELIADKIPNQAGYAYLASVFLKMGFFVFFFQSSVFAKEEFTKPEKFSLILPLFIFLIIESVAISKLLNSK